MVSLCLQCSLCSKSLISFRSGIHFRFICLCFHFGLGCKCSIRIRLAVYVCGIGLIGQFVVSRRHILLQLVDSSKFGICLGLAVYIRCISLILQFRLGCVGSFRICRFQIRSGNIITILIAHSLFCFCCIGYIIYHDGCRTTIPFSNSECSPSP